MQGSFFVDSDLLRAEMAEKLAPEFDVRLAWHSIKTLFYSKLNNSADICAR